MPDRGPLTPAGAGGGGVPKGAAAELEKAPRAIGRMFDAIAPSYDLLNHMLSMAIDVRWRKRAIRSLSLRKEDMVLDIASGTGDMALLAHAASGCAVLGLDLSGNMLREAVRKCGPTYMAVQGDALRMPFPDAAFGKAMTAFGIRNMADIPAFLREVRRVLRPHGTLVVLEFSLPPYPLVRQAYLLYLTRVLPFVGGLRSGNRAAYQYLSDSIQRFPSPRSMLALFTEAGLEVAEMASLTLGIAHLYVLRSPGAGPDGGA